MPIDLLAVQDLKHSDVERLAGPLGRAFRTTCRIREDRLEAAFAHNPARGQYYSTAILQALQPLANGNRLLAVTGHDLFVPIFTFVFGEAQLAGNCAVVSLHRLREEAYGLPPDPRLLEERLLKEAIHELGHTFGLRHCDDWRCAMSSSHSVERLDLKSVELCRTCRRQVTW